MPQKKFGKVQRFKDGLADRSSNVISFEDARTFRNSVVKTVTENRNSELLARFLAHATAGALPILCETSPRLDFDQHFEEGTDDPFAIPAAANTNDSVPALVDTRESRGNLIEILIQDD